MSKKVPNAKSTKALSRAKMNDHEHQLQGLKQSLNMSWKGQITRLESMISVEAQQRKINQSKILNLIKHLQETKKSKLALNPEILNINRMLSPSKSEKIVVENQSIVECKNMLTTIKSETQLEANMNKCRISQIEKEISKIYNQNISLLAYEQNILNLNRQMSLMRDQILQQNSYFQKQIYNLSSCLSQKVQKSQQTLNINICSILKQQVEHQRNSLIRISSQLDRKLATVQQSVKISLQTLSSLQCKASESFQTLQQEIKQASQSIAQTKQTIQQTFSIYGSEYRSKQKIQKFQSVSSLQSTPETPFLTSNPNANIGLNINQKRVSQHQQKYNYMEKRVNSLQRRVDLIYGQYLATPLHGHQPQLQSGKQM